MAKNIILGVDVGTGSVKALAGTIDSNGRIAILGSGVVPSDGIDKGELSNVRAAAAAVKAAVDCTVMAANVSPDKIYLGIGGLDVSSVNSLGSIAVSGLVTEKEVTQACRAAAASVVNDNQLILHALPINYRLDEKRAPEAPLGKKGVQLEVEAHIVTVTNALVSAFVEALAVAGVQVDGVMANSIAGVKSFIAPGSKENCLVLDIGAGVTDLALYHGGKVRLSASVPLGGDYITSDIMQGLGVSQAQAEEIKRQYARLNKRMLGQDVMLDCSENSGESKPVSYDFLHKVVESRVEEIVSLLQIYLEPALAKMPADRIVLTGGCAMLPCFAENVDKLFHVPASLLTPEGLSAEYAHPSNVACFGLLCYVAGLYPAVKPEPGGGWRSVFRRIKNLI